MTLSNRPGRFLIRIHPVAVGRAAAQTREERNEPVVGGREAPMIYGRHYGPDNYMLPYGRPLVHVARKKRERIGRWYPACWPAIHNDRGCCSNLRNNRTDESSRPFLLIASIVLIRFDIPGGQVWVSTLGSQLGQIAAEGEKLRGSNYAMMPAIWWRLPILRTVALATDDYGFVSLSLRLVLVLRQEILSSILTIKDSWSFE